MSFGNNSGMDVVGNSTKECTPDYEAQAARMKIKLDSTNNLSKAMVDFIKTNGTHRVGQVSSFAELFGGIVIIREEQKSIYEELLERLEKEK